MKKWQIPNVKIEKFTSNEYVSSCSDHLVSFSGFTPFFDLNNDGLYDNGERATFTNSPPPYGVKQFVESGAYEDIYIYRQGSSTPPYQAPYSGEYFPYPSSGPYYIYVAERGDTKRAWIYDSDYRPASTPTTTQSFS